METPASGSKLRANPPEGLEQFPIRHLVILLLASASLMPGSRAATVESPNPAILSHRMAEAVDVFAENSVLRPTDPFQLVPGKDPNGWSFMIEPYVWAMGLEGQVGVAGLPPNHVGASSIEVLRHLDWGIFSKAEIRKGRWGILGDGLFAQLSASGDPAGRLYRSADVTIQQGMVSLALAYRVIDDRRGFLDVYAGARYNYLGLVAGASVDPAGIQEIGNDISDRIADRIAQKAREIITSTAGVTRSELVTGINNAFKGRRLENAAATPRDVKELLPDRALPRIYNLNSGAVSEYISAVSEAQLAAAKNALTTQLQERVAKAKKNLSEKIAHALEKELPTSASGEQSWVDPIVGLRGQINFTRWLFLGTQGDVGGFGAGSQIAWNVQASVGINFTRNIFAELGYRYMYVDYTNGGFLYQVNSFGLFSGVGVKF